MHLRVEETISILEINTTKRPSRKPCSCLPVCPLKVEWCVLMMGVLILLGNLLEHMFNPTAEVNNRMSKTYGTAQHNVKVTLRTPFGKGCFWVLLLYFGLVVKYCY